MKSLTKENGSITVFLLLSVMIILLLVLALFQGARIGAVRMKTECVADIATNSVLSEYSRELYEQYGLLMVDSSYGSDSHSILNSQERLKHYVQKNFERSLYGKVSNAQTLTAMYCKDARITGYSLATDNKGGPLERQIIAYMSAEPVGALMGDVLESVGSLEGSGFDSVNVDEMANANQETIDSIELPKIKNEDGNEETISIGNPADAVNSQRGMSILGLVVKDRSQISMARITGASCASKRQLQKGTGLNDKGVASEGEKLLLDEYYFEKCSRFGNELEKSVLKYQMEYLIYGQDSDYANLEKMAKTLLFWRQASNFTYLLSCQAKLQQAELMATALSAVILCPELTEPIKYSILFAWTFAESISDLRILFAGGRVPLFKSDATWNLGIFEMLDFRGSYNKTDCGEGLYYKDYLRMKAFMTSGKEKLFHMMDIIEMDIRNTQGNSAFRIDDCIDVMRADITVGTRFGYEAHIERVFGYEE